MIDVVLESYLGSGASSRVYKAFWNEFPVVAKLVNLNPAILQEELEMTRKLLHPNLVMLIGNVSDNGNNYIISELVKDGDLYSAIHKQNTIKSVKLGMQLMNQVSYGLFYLHANNVSEKFAYFFFPNVISKKKKLTLVTGHPSRSEIGQHLHRFGGEHRENRRFRNISH